MSIEMKTAKNGSKYYTLYGINEEAEKKLFAEVAKNGLHADKYFLKRIMVFENGSKLSIRVEGYGPIMSKDGKHKRNGYAIQENGQRKDLAMTRVAYNMGTINIKPHAVEVYSMEEKSKNNQEVFYGFRPGIIKAGDRRIRTISNNPGKLIAKLQQIMKYSLYHEDIEIKRKIFYANISKTSQKNYLLQGSNSMVIVSLFMNQLKDSVESKLFDITWKTLKKNGHSLRNIDPSDFDRRLGDLILLARYPLQQELYHIAKAKYKSMTLPSLEELQSQFEGRSQNAIGWDANIVNRPTSIKTNFKWHSFNVTSSLNDAFRCKTIKQCVKRIFGNNGKQMTKIFMNSVLTIKQDLDTRTPVCTHTVKMSIQSNFLEAGLIAKHIFTVDHMQKLFAAPPTLKITELDKQVVSVGMTQTTFANLTPSIINAAQIGAWLNKNQKMAIYHSTPAQLEEAYFGVGRRDYIPTVNQELHEKLGFMRLRPAGTIKATVQFFKMFSVDRAFRLWNSINSVDIFEDTVRQWWIIKHLIEVPKDFKDMTAVHDYVSKEYRKIKQKDFPLLFNEREDLKRLDGVSFSDVKTKRTLQIITPKTNWEIVEWGQTLNNCIGSYGVRVNEKKDLSQILLGVNVNGKLTYALEVVKGTVCQFYGVRNSGPDKDDKAVVLEVINKYGIGRDSNIMNPPYLRGLLGGPGPIVEVGNLGAPLQMAGLEQVIGQPLEENHFNDALRYAVGADIRPDQPMMVNANMVAPEWADDREEF